MLLGVKAGWYVGQGVVGLRDADRIEDEVVFLGRGLLGLESVLQYLHENQVFLGIRIGPYVVWVAWNF